jgi:signal transduction histidine kinase
MARKKKPVLRLTLFFIAVVIASGSILAYLSINNISNLKELTEKRVEEEQKNLALALSDHVHGLIFELADNFSEYLDSQNVDDAAGSIALDTLDLAEQVFVIDRNGHFLWPWYVDGSENRIERVSTERYRTLFSQAERAEFIESNFDQARDFYLASLRASSEEYDSVHSLNALARLAVKSDDSQQALNYYSTLTSSYYFLCDPHGFPYVYYAIPQLIKISNSSIRQDILQEIEFCLAGMGRGEIPLNQSTADILEQVKEWLELDPTPNERVGEINKSINRVRNHLSFIEGNKALIRESLDKEGINEIPPILGKFQVVNGIEADRGELILLKYEGERAVGFSVLLEQLWSRVLEDELLYETGYEYEVELVRGANGATAMDNSGLITAELSPYFPGQYLQVRLKNENLIDEFVRRRSWIFGISLTLLLGGMILGVLLILRDISREEHLARLRSDFISNVTHELKTPLTSIQLFTESILLKRVKSAVQKKEYLQIILKETESLKRMINNILDFSRREKGKPDYNFEEVNVTLLLQAALTDLDYWLEEKNFTLLKEMEDPVMAMADPAALKQAIINLLNNAIKFSVKRKEIAVRLKKEEEMVLLQVEDKGIGIPENQKDLIFQPFYRVGQKNSEDISGTGLGLAVVKEIVEAHHGTIKVESRLNQGSTFTILFKAIQEN